MRNGILILYVLLLLGCNKSEHIQLLTENNTVFYEDEIIMRDISKETKYVDSIYNVTTKTVSKEYKRKEGSVPISREQLIHFLKCINVCLESKKDLMTVLVNKNNGFIVSLNNTNIPNCDIITKEQLFTLLKSNLIDFKIIEPIKTDNSPIQVRANSNKICTAENHVVYRSFYSSNDSFFYGSLNAEVELETPRYLNEANGGECTSAEHLPEVLNVRTYKGTGIGEYTHTRWRFGSPRLTIVTTGIWTITFDLAVTDFDLVYEITTRNYLKNEDSVLKTTLSYELI